jgi:hypothetical protein
MYVPSWEVNVRNIWTRLELDFVNLHFLRNVFGQMDIHPWKIHKISTQKLQNKSFSDILERNVWIGTWLPNTQLI